MRVWVVCTWIEDDDTYIHGICSSPEEAEKLRIKYHTREGVYNPRVLEIELDKDYGYVDDFYKGIGTANGIRDLKWAIAH